MPTCSRRYSPTPSQGRSRRHPPHWPLEIRRNAPLPPRTSLPTHAQLRTTNVICGNVHSHPKSSSTSTLIPASLASSGSTMLYFIFSHTTMCFYITHPSFPPFFWPMADHGSNASRTFEPYRGTKVRHFLVKSPFYAKTPRVTTSTCSQYA